MSSKTSAVWARRQAWLASAALGLVATPPSPAGACATCDVGDPTLLTMGTGQSRQGRLRGSLELSHRTDRRGASPGETIRLSEQRADVALAFAPLDSVMLSARVPFLHRRLEWNNLARDTNTTLGDVELRGRFRLWADQTFAPTHVLVAIAGVQLPTAPARTDGQGRSLPLELQAGTGSIDPLAGAAWSYFADAFSLYVSTVVLLPTSGTDGAEAGHALFNTAMAQYQPAPTWGVRLSVDSRLEAKTQEREGPDPDSGGFIAFLTPGLVVRPLPDLVAYASVSVPTIDRLNGNHDEGIILRLGAAQDF